jgi:hypothetical protein
MQERMQQQVIDAPVIEDILNKLGDYAKSHLSDHDQLMRFLQQLNRMYSDDKSGCWFESDDKRIIFLADLTLLLQLVNEFNPAIKSELVYDYSILDKCIKRQMTMPDRPLTVSSQSLFSPSNRNTDQETIAPQPILPR